MFVRVESRKQARLLKQPDTRVERAMTSKHRNLSAEVTAAFGDQRSAHEATFIQLADDIAEAMRQGHRMSTIHKFLREQKRIAFGYDTFRRYVAKHLGRDAAHTRPSRQPPLSETPGPQPPARDTVLHSIKRATAPAQCDLDPRSRTDPDDLT